MQGAAAHICFGLNRATDEESLALFVKKVGEDRLLDTLIPRLDDEEITAVFELFSSLMRKHLSEQEYHQLFLDD
jgi:hypothetical protein